MNVPDPAGCGELPSHAETAPLFATAETPLDEGPERGCPVHKPSPRKGVPSRCGSAAVTRWRLRDACRPLGARAGEALDPRSRRPSMGLPTVVHGSARLASGGRVGWGAGPSHDPRTPAVPFKANAA